jgi:nucleoid-associated protein YgaU
MASRYDSSRPFVNNDELYEEFFEERGIKQVRQYATGIMRQPTVEERAGLQRIDHIWRLGDRLSKLAHQYYGDPSLWWIIAWYNQRPTEAHFKIGAKIRIPLPLDRVMAILKRY